MSIFNQFLSCHSTTPGTVWLWLNLYARAMASLTTILPNSRVFPPKNIITCRIFLIYCVWIDYGLLRCSFNENLQTQIVFPFVRPHVLAWVDRSTVGANQHYYQYTRQNRKSASSKHTLSGPQMTDSGLLMHYQPYSWLVLASSSGWF